MTPLSHCHNAACISHSSDEGTGYCVCSTCAKPCNPVYEGSAWDAMSDTEKVEWLATEVMGWEWHEIGKINGSQATGAWCILEKPEEAFENDSSDDYAYDWNPLTNWNHWRQVEEKVMEIGQHLKAVYIAEMHQAHSCTIAEMSEAMLKADLSTRARCLYLAYQSLR